jgi:hypothetical protein
VTSSNRLYFVENLTLRAWLLTVLPRLILGALRRQHHANQCYVLEGSRLAMLVARLSAAPAGVHVSQLKYRVRDMHDEQGRMIRLRIDFGDLLEVQRYAVAEPAFQELLESGQLRDRLPLYLAKGFGHEKRLEPNNFWHSLFRIQACVWKAKELGRSDSEVMVFIARRPWSSSLNLYAAKYGLLLIHTYGSLDLKGVVRRNLPKPVEDLARTFVYGLSQGNLLKAIKSHISWKLTSVVANPRGSSHAGTQGTVELSHPKILINYAGQLNLNHPHLHSDLFFWQQSPLLSDNLLMAFSLFNDPLDEHKRDQLAEHGIQAIVLDPKAASVPEARVFKAVDCSKNLTRPPKISLPRGREGKWLKEYIADYEERRAYWTQIFESSNSKVYVTYQNTHPEHIAIADALGEVGGVMAMYQRSYEPNPTPMLSTYSDIAFRFSNATVPWEKLSNSVIQYHVATGYLGDHRFGMLRARSGAIRAEFERNGANRVLAYYDENSGDNVQLHSGHEFMQENYTFLLEKVLSEPWLALILKPKNPRSLRRRLGPVAQQLEEALATGRCYVYEGGPIQCPHSPTEAALEADLAIHGHLYGGTAGVEAALAGVPTLMLDREGWPMSPLYRFPKDKVVFTDWTDLWKASIEHWAVQGGTPGFGDWSLLLDDLDPFRDGHAAERMGTYLHWLMEGFEAGSGRDTVMADAAERYTARWGSDKVNQVNGGWHPGEIYASNPISTKLLDLSRSPAGHQDLAQGSVA